MDRFLNFSHASEQIGSTNSTLISFFTVLGIVFLFGAIIQEARETYTQQSSSTQQVASMEEK